MQTYQILIVVISLVMISKGLFKFFRKKTHFSFWKLLMETVIWGGISIVIIFPERVMNYLSDILGIKEGFNALILVGFILVLILIFRLLTVIERIEKDLTKVVRQEALSKLRK